MVEPGQPTTLYHAESSQEDFLVLSGECVAIVEGEERHLHAWDFVHCPPGTGHAFVGAGDGPCVLLGVGARSEEGTIVYPQSEAAGQAWRQRRRGDDLAARRVREVRALAARPSRELGRAALGLTG